MLQLDDSFASCAGREIKLMSSNEQMRTLCGKAILPWVCEKAVGKQLTAFRKVHSFVLDGDSLKLLLRESS